MEYDVLVLGSGPGGYVAAIRASQLGLKTAVVEKESLGGVCLNWGCIPTKALIKSAQVFEYIQHAEEYGITVKDAKHDFGKVVARSRDIAGGMSKGIQFLMKKNKIDVHMGQGTLMPGRKVEVKGESGTQVISAKHIIIATGGRSRVLPNLPQDGKKIIGYREAMVLPEQPKSMVIVGSGAIGVEFAYVYHAMGTKVTVVEYLPRIVPNEDEEVSKALEQTFKKKGIEVLTGTEVKSVDTKGKGCKVTYADAKGEHTMECDVVLSAVGVMPNLENIGLESVGIAVDKGRVVVDDFYRTNIPGYYAIGDIVPGPMLAHKATHEAKIAAEVIAGHKAFFDARTIPSVAYTDPEIAWVGLTETEAKAKSIAYEVGKFPWAASGRAIGIGRTEGFTKLLFDPATHRVIGAGIVGSHAGDLIAEIALAIEMGCEAADIGHTIHPHPTLSETVAMAAEVFDGSITDLYIPKKK